MPAGPIFRIRLRRCVDIDDNNLLPNARAGTTRGSKGEGNPMTKAELVEAVASQSRLTKKAATEVLDVVFGTIGKAVKKDARFSYPGFGTWSIRTRKARKIRNPQTNEIMKLKATKTIGFRPAKELKQSL